MIKICESMWKYPIMFKLLKYNSFTNPAPNVNEKHPGYRLFTSMKRGMKWLVSDFKVKSAVWDRQTVSLLHSILSAV